MDLVDYSFLSKNIFNDVYEPSEDSFILLDALEKDFERIKGIRPKICLEIGSGSGVVITSLGKLLGPACYLSTDINFHAASTTKAVSRHSNIPVDVVVTDLAKVFESRLEKSIDLIICNPPYAVSPDEEVGGDNLQKATSGGKKGRQVINRLIPIVPKLLSPQGYFYLVCIAENDINDIAQCFDAFNLETTVVLQRRCGIERLFVLRIFFKQTIT